MSKSRSFIITDWENKVSFYEDYIKCGKKIKYVVVGEDMGEEAGGKTEGKHFHAWVYFENPRTLTSVIKETEPRHVEITKGKTDQILSYVVKPEFNPNGPLFEYGTRPQQGKRTDLHEAAEKVFNGERTPASYLNPEEANIYHQYGRTLEKIYEQKLKEKRRNKETKILWIWGESGVGKSRIAYEDFGEDYYIWNYNKAGWQDNYTGQNIVIMDDFRGEIKYEDLLRLADRYPLNLPVKYKDPVPFTSELIIITSSKPPAEIYGNNDDLEQLNRRMIIRDGYNLVKYEEFGGFFNQELLIINGLNIKLNLPN